MTTTRTSWGSLARLIPQRRFSRFIEAPASAQDRLSLAAVSGGDGLDAHVGAESEQDQQQLATAYLAPGGTDRSTGLSCDDPPGPWSTHRLMPPALAVDGPPSGEVVAHHVGLFVPTGYPLSVLGLTAGV